MRGFDKKGRYWTVLGVVALALAGCRSSNSKPQPKATTAAPPATSALLPKRTVYPWSVVPGGLDSPESMRAAMQKDPVVESHYAGLDPEIFHVERLAEKRQGYVSYRVRDKVYWSRRMVTLAAGETVLTDGRSIVRGRCGNLYSPVAHQPVAQAAAEPTEEAMDQPVAAAQLDLIPAAPVEVPVDTEKFENPKELAATMAAGSLLASSDADGSMMPPVFGIGGISSPGGGILGAIGGASSGGGGGGGTTPANPATEPAAPTPFHNVEIAPPLVLIALASQPNTFLPPTTPTIPPPSLDYPPTPEYPPITPYIPSTPPWEHPTPPGPPPVIYRPPPTNPPSAPPPDGPPADHPKPPDTPPPPSNPPPYLPPPDGPPTAPPPTTPPPPTQSIPEPSAWMMMALGIGAIAIGAIRRKS